MALETMKDVKEIGGFVVHKNNWKSGGTRFVEVNHEDNAITFKIQNGPIKQHGVNGCQVDTMIQAAMHIVTELNKKFPCRENSLAITNLQLAVMWLEERKKDRIKRGVEGTDNP